MKRVFCRRKIHQARVTAKDLEYSGSITIDEEIVERADLREGEMVSVLNLENGARFDTYVIVGERGSGEICINGAAARLVELGDRVLILVVGIYDEDEIEDGLPVVVYLDENNKIVSSS